MDEKHPSHPQPANDPNEPNPGDPPSMPEPRIRIDPSEDPRIPEQPEPRRGI